MKLNLISLSLCIICALLLVSCSTQIQVLKVKDFPPVEANKEVRVFEEGETIPVNTETIGKVKIGDSGFSVNCSYPVVIEQARNEARKMGGDALRIVVHKYPSIWGSSCHQILADVLKISDDTVVVSSAPIYSDTIKNNAVQPGVVAPVQSFNVKYRPFRLAFTLGWGYQLAKTVETGNDEMDDFSRRLRSGMDLSASAAYYWSQQYGAGFNVRLFCTSASTKLAGNYQTGYDNGLTLPQYTLREGYEVLFLAPTFNMRNFTLSNKGNTFSSLAIGYLTLHDEVSIDGVKSAVMYGGNIGFLAELGYEHSLSETTSLNFSLSALSGVLSSYTAEIAAGQKVKVKIEDSKEYIGLGRINISAGLSFNLGKVK